jgi:hypothetical protein
MSDFDEKCWEQKQAKERQEREDLLKTLAITAAAVAGELGYGWHPVLKGWEENGYANIAHDDGRGISFAVAVYHFKGKVSISGDYDFGPRELNISFPYGKSRPDITVTLARGPVVIAKEIARRFLPTYNERFAEISATVKSYTENRDRKQGIAERLAAVAGFRAGERITKDGFSTYRSDGPYLDVKVYSDVEITVKSCSEELAAKIIKLVSEQ